MIFLFSHDFHSFFRSIIRSYLDKSLQRGCCEFLSGLIHYPYGAASIIAVYYDRRDDLSRFVARFIEYGGIMEGF